MLEIFMPTLPINEGRILLGLNTLRRHSHRRRIEVDEVAPAFVGAGVFAEPEHRPPARGGGLAQRVHVDLVGQLVRLAGVATDAGGDDVFPCGPAAFVAGQDVVEIEIGLAEDLGAVLAGVLVAQEDIAAGEADLHARKFFVKSQHDDLRHPQGDADGVDHFLDDFPRRVLHPRAQVVSPETVVAFGLHHLRVTEEEELQGTPDGAGLHRLPEPVEDEDGIVEMRYHAFSQQLPRKLAGRPDAARKSLVTGKLQLR